jgi:hypothetical protein
VVALAPDAGSFRDPLSRVASDGDRVVRLLAGRGVDDARAALASPGVAELVADGAVVASRELEGAEAAAVLGDGPYTAALEHPRLPFISYPYEWSFAMLRDAALLTLRILRRTLADGITLKDATPYNVQFVGSRPTFIDVGSFERRAESDPWFGYAQFASLHLYPLMLQSYTGAAFQPWLRGSLEGIAPTDIDGILRGARLRRRRGRLVHVRLAAAAAKRASERSEDVETEAKRARFSGRVLDNTWRNLERLVRRLEWGAARSTWSAYGTRDHYAEPDLAAKDAFVRAAVEARPRRLVYDLGANDGRFARIAAEHAPHVVAADADVLVVDRLYRTLRSEGDERIQPLALDLADPSPGLGFGGGERSSFARRGRPDLVLYLAVVHHLAITRTVPLAMQLDELAALGAEVVFELPTEDDPKVRTLLLAKRRGLFDDYRADVADRLIGERFDVAHRETLASGTRILYHLTPKP